MRMVKRKWSDGNASASRRSDRSSTLVSALLSSFREEPGETVADVINAVTRTAHSKVPVMVGEIIEKQAGKLIAAIPAW